MINKLTQFYNLAPIHTGHFISRVGIKEFSSGIKFKYIEGTLSKVIIKLKFRVIKVQ
jgi:hypothetical protein